MMPLGMYVQCSNVGRVKVRKEKALFWKLGSIIKMYQLTFHRELQ